MGILVSYSLFVNILLVVIDVLDIQLTYAASINSHYRINSFNRSNFPSSFVFGAASSAYQIEGAANEDGKGPSIWDTFARNNHSEKIRDHNNGNIATDSYHRYKEDVEMVKQTGFDAYRFSISWPRLLPQGKLSGGVSEGGLQYYDNLINLLRKKGIEPYVTLFHWDLPQALEDEYGGFLSKQIVSDYVDYVELCFKRYGDRVKQWITLNEPYSYAVGGYVNGEFAPGRSRHSGVEPYLVAHNQLLAHGAAVKLYRDKYQNSQKGKIGIALVARWMIPYTNRTVDLEAQTRALDFGCGWFLDPLTKGDYPQSMKDLVRERLPRFSEEESEKLKKSFDFIGLNYYTTYYAKHDDYRTNSMNTSPTYITDSQTLITGERNGVSIGPKGASDWLYVYPKGIQETLLYIRKNYNNPTIYITENGVDEVNNSTLSLKESHNDNMRIDCYFNHLSNVQKAIKKGVDVRGFFAWALMDNFEWNSGFSVRFGLYYVDYKDGLKRYPKLSARWFRQFLKR